MGDEDRAELRKRQFRERELARDAVAAVNEIDTIADDDHLRGCRMANLWRRTAGGPEQDEARARLLRRLCERGDAEKRRARGQKRSAREVHVAGHDRLYESRPEGV